MRVRIDEAGNDDAASQIDFAGAAGFGQALDAATRTDGGDESIANQNRAVEDDVGPIEGFAAARRGSAKREDLGAICDEQRFLHAGLRHEIGFYGTEIRRRLQGPCWNGAHPLAD